MSIPDEFELDFGQLSGTHPETPQPEAQVDAPRRKCPGCAGKGRYVGLNVVEDPCRVCNGKGEVSSEIVWDDLNVAG